MFQSLSMGGSHSQVEGYIASPTFPLCWYTIHGFVPHTTTVDIFCVHHCSTNNKLGILVRAQLRTQSTWPLSPTRLAIWLRDLGPTQRIHSWSLHVAFLLLLDTNLLSQAGLHYSLNFFFFCKRQKLI